MQIHVCSALLASLLWRSASAGYAVASLDAELAAEVNPIRKVVTLLEDMKAQVQKEAEEDTDATEKYGCWCTTNSKQKTEAVDVAIKKVAELEAFIEQAAGLTGQLKTEISSLEADIAAGQESLDKASKLKESETAAFESEEKDAKETVAAVSQALAVLAKVQLLQKQGGKAPKSALLQLKGVVQALHARAGGEFRSVMQQDLWDVVSSIDAQLGSKGQAGFLSAVEENGHLSSIQPNDLEGNAAGAKSYNARSGSIVGILAEMKDEFERNLKAEQKEELESMIAFQKLRSSKLAEIQAATASKDDKQATLADTMEKKAQAEEDVEATKGALSADQQFLVGLAKSCSENEESYNKRSAERSEELKALGEAITILTEDEARDSFGKTLSLLQTGSVGAQKGAAAGALTTDAARNQAVTRAMKMILGQARKHSNWMLATLAVRVRLDPFTKVHEALDKMLAELKEQQKAEVTKMDFCKKEVDTIEDTIKTKSQDREDLEGKKLSLENSVASLDVEIAAMQAQVADLQVSLKTAGEDRKVANTIFQTSVADQRATMNILQKARARLAKFYEKGSLVQTAAGQPGQAVGAEPEKAKAYSKSGGAGGVLQLLDMVTADAKRAEAELILAENYAQEDYMSLVQDTNSAIGMNEAALVEKTKIMQQATAEKSETEGSLLANGEELQKLQEILKGMHLDCDFVMKYFQVRQDARAEEMSAIQEAKAILSGANFGKEDSA